MSRNEMFIKTILQADIHMQWMLFIAFFVLALLSLASLLISCFFLRKSIVHINSKKERSKKRELTRLEGFVVFDLIGILILCTLNGISLTPKYTDLRAKAMEYVTVADLSAIEPQGTDQILFFNGNIKVRPDSGSEIRLKLPYGETEESIMKHLPGTIVYAQNSRIILQVIPEDRYEQTS